MPRKSGKRKQPPILPRSIATDDEQAAGSPTDPIRLLVRLITETKRSKNVKADDHDATVFMPKDRTLMLKLLDEAGEESHLSSVELPSLVALLEQTELDQLLEINLVVSILLRCEDHESQRRCIYLIAKNFFRLSEGSQQGKKKDITEALMHKLLSILVGDDALSSSHDSHFLLRRVVAILLFNVVTASAVNKQLLIDQPLNILQRIGAIASNHEDLILGILAGRLIDSMLETDTSFCLEDLWPLSQESNVLEKFPAPGLSSLEWNNQFQRFVRGNKQSSVTHLRHLWGARAVASVPESYFVRQRSICLCIRAGVLSIWAQPGHGEFEDMLDTPLTVIDTVDIVESLLDSKETLHASLNLQLNLKATGLGDNCVLNYASTTLSSIRVIPESVSELSTMSDTLRSFLPKYKGRVLTCISPIRNSRQSSNSLDDMASLAHENSKQSPDAFDPQVRAESPTPRPRNRRPPEKIIPTTGEARQAAAVHDSPENIQSEKNKTKQFGYSPPQVSVMKRAVISTYSKNRTRLPKSALTAKPALKLTRLTESKITPKISSNPHKEIQSNLVDEVYGLDELQELSARKLFERSIDSVASNPPPTDPTQTNNALPRRPSIPQKALTSIKAKHPPKPRLKKLEKHKADTNNTTVSEQAPLRKSSRNAAKVANTKLLQTVVTDTESSIREETLPAPVKSSSPAKRDVLFPQLQWKKPMAKEDLQVALSPLKPKAISKVDSDNGYQEVYHEKVSPGWDVPELVTSDNVPSMLSPIAYDGDDELPLGKDKTLEDKNDSIKSTMAAQFMHLLPPSQQVKQVFEEVEQDTSTLSEIDHQLSKFFGPAILNEKIISTGEHVERSDREEQAGPALIPGSRALDEMVDDVDTFSHILADTQAVRVSSERGSTPVIDPVYNNETKPDTPKMDVMQHNCGEGTTNANVFPVEKIISPCPNQAADRSRQLEHLERSMQKAETLEQASQLDDASDQNTSLVPSTLKKGPKSSLESRSKIATTTPAHYDMLVEMDSTIGNNDRDSTAKVFQNKHELHRSHQDDFKQNVVIDEAPDAVTPKTARRTKSPQPAPARPIASENVIILQFVAAFTPYKPVLQHSNTIANTSTAISIESQGSPRMPILEAPLMELEPSRSKQNNSSSPQRDWRLTRTPSSIRITDHKHSLPVSKISHIDSLIQRDQTKTVKSPIHVELHYDTNTEQDEVASRTMKLPPSPDDKFTESFAKNSADALMNKVSSFTAAHNLSDTDTDTVAQATTKSRTFMVVNSKSKPVHVLSDTEKVEENKYRPHRQTEDGSYVDIQTRKISVAGDMSQPLLSDPFGKQVQRATSSRVVKALDSLPPIRKVLSGAALKVVARPRVKIDTGVGDDGDGPPRKRSRPESEDERTLINPPDDSDQGSSDTSSDSGASSIGHSSDANVHETVLGEEKETIEEIWERAIQPHHQGVTQSMTLMLNELIRVLVDKETAIRLVVEDYERGANRLVKHVEEQQRASQSNREQEFNMSRIIAEDKCKKLKGWASDIFESSEPALRDKESQEWKKKQDNALKLLQDAKLELGQ